MRAKMFNLAIEASSPWRDDPPQMSRAVENMPKTCADAFSRKRLGHGDGHPAATKKDLQIWARFSRLGAEYLQRMPSLVTYSFNASQENARTSSQCSMSSEIRVASSTLAARASTSSSRRISVDVAAPTVIVNNFRSTVLEAVDRVEVTGIRGLRHGALRKPYDNSSRVIGASHLGEAINTDAACCRMSRTTPTEIDRTARVKHRLGLIKGLAT